MQSRKQFNTSLAVERKCLTKLTSANAARRKACQETCAPYQRFITKGCKQTRVARCSSLLLYPGPRLWVWWRKHGLIRPPLSPSLYRSLPFGPAIQSFCSNLFITQPSCHEPSFPWAEREGKEDPTTQKQMRAGDWRGGGRKGRGGLGGF